MSVFNLRIQPPRKSKLILNRQDAKRNKHQNKTKTYRTTEKGREPEAGTPLFVGNSCLCFSLRPCGSIIILLLLASWRLVILHAEGSERGGALRPRRLVESGGSSFKARM